MPAWRNTPSSTHPQSPRSTAVSKHHVYCTLHPRFSTLFLEADSIISLRFFPFYNISTYAWPVHARLKLECGGMGGLRTECYGIQPFGAPPRLRATIATIARLTADACWTHVSGGKDFSNERREYEAFVTMSLPSPTPSRQDESCELVHSSRLLSVFQLRVPEYNTGIYGAARFLGSAVHTDTPGGAQALYKETLAQRCDSEVKSIYSNCTVSSYNPYDQHNVETHHIAHRQQRKTYGKRIASAVSVSILTDCEVGRGHATTEQPPCDRRYPKSDSGRREAQELREEHKGVEGGAVGVGREWEWVVCEADCPGLKLESQDTPGQSFRQSTRALVSSEGIKNSSPIQFAALSLIYRYLGSVSNRPEGEISHRMDVLTTHHSPKTLLWIVYAIDGWMWGGVELDSWGFARRCGGPSAEEAPAVSRTVHSVIHSATLGVDNTIGELLKPLNGLIE
ncbi:hypothetical protein DFP72DRAFT_848574 [Ephemerocybe angulata]|uniref:Uncharacterized protein n=1 Tax=Ephemerocybe angulata TaxID=980116 RepID=A0A8H6HW37_9AGAR|nr:hypothetical protein DFP72DRAFT_848574 [Tulosesus angulatus]